MSQISQVFASPGNRAAFLIQGNYSALAATRRDGYQIAIDQRGFGIAPVGSGAAEVLGIILAPHFFATIGLVADQVSPLADAENKFTVGGWRGAGPRESRLADFASFAEFGRPNRLAIRNIASLYKTCALFVTRRKEPIAENRNRAETMPKIFDFPNTFRPALGPLFE